MNDVTEFFAKTFSELGEDYNAPQLNMLLVSLISSDTIVTAEDAIKCKKVLQEVEKGIKKSTLSDKDKEHWLEFVEKGYEIIDRDCQELRKR